MNTCATNHHCAVNNSYYSQLCFLAIGEFMLFAFGRVRQKCKIAYYEN